MLLGVMLLVAAPAMPTYAASTQPCCLDMACHSDVGSACPDDCVLACQAVIAPAHAYSKPIRRTFVVGTGGIAAFPAGRAIAPDLPPPRSSKRSDDFSSI